MRKQTLQYVRLAHKRLMADDNEFKKPSPWFGELYSELKKIWCDEENEIDEFPDRPTVLSILLKSDIAFRTSGDYSEDYRTIYHNPTTADSALMGKLASRNVVVETEEDRRQIPMF
jgi:hypothetical protein